MVGDYFFFSADDGQHGRELWVYLFDDWTGPARSDPPGGRLRRPAPVPAGDGALAAVVPVLSQAVPRAAAGQGVDTPRSPRETAHAAIDWLFTPPLRTGSLDEVAGRPVLASQTTEAVVEVLAEAFVLPLA